MDNIKRNIEEEKEFLALQEQIRDAAKSAGQSWQQAGSYTKTILANYREMQKVSARMKEIQKEIEKITEDSTDAEKERKKILEQELKSIEKQRNQLLAINKEMVSLNSVVRMGLSGILTYLGHVVTGYLDFKQKVRDTSATIGLGVSNMEMMQSNIQQASIEMNRYGIGVQEAVAAQQAYSDELGRTVILTENAYRGMSKVAKATGLGMEGVTGLVAAMEQFGLGAEDSAGIIYNMYSESAAMGLNAGKVIKKFETNIGLLNKLSFKNGIKGLQKMVQLSEKYKIDINEIVNASEKAFSPEGAIEMAAQLQVMGGSMAALGDPFQLMYKARNNPEKFAEDMAQAAAQSAVFNRQTKEFEVSAMEIDRLRVVAEATGQSVEKLVESAKQTAKVNMFKGLLAGKGLSPEEKDAVAMMTQMVDGKAKIQIGPGKNDIKELSELNDDQLRAILNQKKSAEEAASQATGIMERISNFINQLMVVMYPLFQAIEAQLQPIIDALTDKTTGWVEELKNFFTTFNPSQFIEDVKTFFSSLWDTLKSIGENWKWYLIGAAGIFAGIWLAAQIPAAISFAATAGSMLMSRLGGLIPGGGGAGGGAGAGGGMAALGNAAGQAVQILAFAAAIYLLAKAMKEFNDVNWSSLGKAALAIIEFSIGLRIMSNTLSTFTPQATAAIPSMIGLGAAVVLLGAGLWLMGQVPLANLTVGLLGLVGVLLAFSTLAPVLAVGEVVLLGLGAAFLMIGAGVFLASTGIAILVSSFTDMFKILGNGGEQLFLAGTGFLALAAGIGILTLSLIAMGAASLLALPGLLILGGVTSMLTETATALASSGGGEGITKTVDAINKIDESKLEALKDLSMWMALIGASPTIRFDENLTIDGSIELTGEAGGKSNTDWVNDPIFVSKLKEMITAYSVTDRRGGK